MPTGFSFSTTTPGPNDLDELIDSNSKTESSHSEIGVNYVRKLKCQPCVEAAQLNMPFQFMFSPCVDIMKV
jgi:hypothetical protein